MKLIKSTIICFSVLLIGTAYGQDVITLEMSVKQALENNNNIKIAKNNTVIATEKATVGNAGLLPTLSANGNAGYGSTNAKFERLGVPGQTTIDGAQSFNYGGSLDFSYVLFNGLGTIHTYKKLKINRSASEMQERLKVEGVLLQTIQSYYQVLQTQNNLAISKEALAISKERKERAKLKFDLAGGSKLDWLNAEVDYNSDSVNFVSANNNFTISKFNLNHIIGSGEETNYKVNDVVDIDKTLTLQSLQSAASENSALVLKADYNKQLAEYDLKLNKSSMQPNLAFKSGYNYNHSENEASIFSFQETNGWNTSLQLSIPIFDGNKKSTQTQISKINVENATYTRIEVERELNRDLLTAYANYMNSINIAALDKQSIETAQLNFDRSKEFLILGQISNTQFREAQLNLLRVKNQSFNNQIAIKLYEVDLMRLSGQLMQ